ncbi:MAG: 23S rRNA (pseudouridine(1915)-N(3))-methyltransferase RlmH [Halioglobus sp.]|nr:23S rRNA (pseudouridine(1915)-N(3))-methyltransferase RlmH [Halioglobus sp.]
MRISVVAVGTRMPAWVTHGIDEYSKRMPRELKLLWREIPLARRAKDTAGDQACAAEGDQILKVIPPAERVIALDVGGKRMSTAQLAEQLTVWQRSGDNYSVVIGGPDGLSSSCLARADQCWSLSDLTLPHPLVRVLLIEQLYRAWTITVNHPYHRA